MAKPEKEVEVGDKFGECTVIEVGLTAPNGSARAKAVLLKCSCGTTSIATIYDLTQRISCSRCQTNSATHGHASGGRETPEYSAWKNILKRCLIPSHPSYHYYGGRGISVCPEWVDSFETFIRDVGLRPSSKHSIDRINNDGNYCPENCRWATKAEQSRNHRGNHLIAFNGETATLTDWAIKLGIKPVTLYGRILTLKWPVEKALTTPVDMRRSHRH